jgi:hypothetical protein
LCAGQTHCEQQGRAQELHVQSLSLFRRLFSITSAVASALTTISAGLRFALNQTVTPKPQAKAKHRMTVTGTGRNEASVSTQKKNNMRIIHMGFGP